MYQQPGYPGPQYYQQMPQRSAIPKVIGILMIIFGALGILGGLIGLAGNGGLGGNELFREVPELKTYRTIEMLTSVLSLGISILQLYAGVRAIGYKSNAIGLAKAYAITRIVAEITSVILVYVWMKPIMDEAFRDSGMNIGGVMGGFMLIFTLIAVAWPIVVLVLMTRPAAKAACTGEL